MSPVPPERGLSGADWRWIGGSFTLAFVVRAVFALTYPTIHGGDAAARLARADSLLLGYQLPLAQAFVWFGKALSDDPLLVRLVFCVFGGLLTAGVVALLRLHDPRSSRFATVLFSSDPLLTHYSIVPYQEPLAYGLLVWALYAAVSSRPTAGGLLMAAACLTRFECWLFLPAFLLASPSRMSALIGALPIFGWVVWWRGLAPPGLYVLDLHAGGGRLSRVAFLGGKFLEYETAILGLAALACVLLALKDRDRALLESVAVVGAVTSVVVALGHEYPVGSGLMSERLIHLPVILALGLASALLARFSAYSRAALVASLLGVLLFAGRNLLFEVRLLRAAAAEPSLALARDAARAIEAVRRPNECVSITAPPVDPRLLADFVAKVESSFGNGERARERARSLATSAPDLDRIAAHLRAPVGTARSQAGCPLVLFVDDPEPAGGDLRLVAEIRAGPRRARLLRTPE